MGESRELRLKFPSFPSKKGQGGEAMLIGEYQHSLDTKGRVNFPAKLREDLGESFILSKGLGDECLFVYSEEEWNKLTEKLNSLPLSKARHCSVFCLQVLLRCSRTSRKNPDSAKSARLCRIAERSGDCGCFQPR